MVLLMGRVSNDQIIDKLKRGMLSWMAGKGAGDTQTDGMDASSDGVLRLQVIPEDPAIVDWPHIVANAIN